MAPTALPESTFTVVWMTLCLVLLFGMLVSDKIGADLTMMFVLTLLMLPRILTVPEAIAGFSNEGLLTVVVLFVVAGGISQTGGLDWYMAKILGRPKTLAGAQFKFMVPIAFVSAFLKNTPVVMVMIPIVQRWAKTIKQPSSQLLIPLSFASILGGTCTLIGTSTNLVVAGLLSQYNFCDPATAYCNTDQTIGLFDLGLYGVPIAMVGIGYILLLSPFLLPYPDQGSGTAEAMTQIDDDDLLVSARITKWSPAGGKTVKDSGMRGLPGLFLVSVQKKESGMTYRAVGPNMRLDAGDILSFTGVVETLGQICEEHGLEPITKENDLDFNRAALNPFTSNRALEEIAEEGPSDINSEAGSVRIPDPHEVEVDALNAYLEEKKSAKDDTAEVAKLGATKEQFMATDKDTRVKAIAYMRSLIRKNVREDGGASPHSPMGQRSRSGSDPNENDTKLDMFRNHNSNNTWSGTSNSDKYPSIQSSLFDDPSQGANGGFRSNSLGGSGSSTPRRVRSNERQNSTGLATLLNSLAPAMVVVAPDPTTSKKNVIFVGVNASDRVGLLHDLSKGMSKLGLQALHTEASVVGLRSVSIWRCEVGGALRRERRRRFGIDEGDVEEIWSVLNSILSEESGTEAIKKRGLRVIRTRVIENSTLIGKTANEAKFRVCFRAAIVAIQRGSKPPTGRLGENDRPPHEEDDLINENASEAGATEGGGGETVTISQDEKLQEKDFLWWSGSANAIGELRKIPGLAPLETDQISKIGQSADRRLVQAVVAKKGPLVGKSIKQSKFRTRFNCAVIAVHREGTKVKDMPGRIVLQAGDVLLLEAGQDFVRLNKDNTLCFALLSELDDSMPPRLKLLVPALLLAVAMLAVYSSGVASLLETALCASAGMVTLGILTQQEARDAVNWDIYVTIAAAFGIGKAMVNSGVAGGVASGLTSVGKSLGIGDSGILAMIYLATFLISNVVTNNAAARLISYTLMLSASASFMSPFGYQTNLMVYGPGGYKYMDFLKFGTPMQIVLWLFSVCILSAKSTFLNFFIIWLASLAFMILAFVGRMKWEMKNLVE
ncbi:hypothetical protein TrLO_g10397 [Triparma laevis f. longispina]|uniref:RCK C-terminal domain-containing protein n=1 Tax=Triparma laevis f. longispina TaxID=1714387 RepID=A0A9W7AXD8_9STRA|nr:hypothetical protein TrLO_g10397 [Triparma laevis f. longispina]